LDGTEEALGVLDKRRQHAERGGVAYYVVASEPDDAGNGGGRQNFDDRVIHGVRHDGIFERVHVDRVHFGKGIVGPLLAVEQLHYHHPADVLLQVRVDAGNGNANPPVGVAHFVAENLGGEGDERQHRKRDQRQLGVHAEHDPDDAGEHEDVLENRNHTGSEHFVHRVHVAGDARDQAANWVLVVEADVDALQMAEDLGAQVEHHHLAGPLHEVGLQVFAQETEDQQAHVQGSHLRDAGERLLAQEPVKHGVQAGHGSEIAIDDDLREIGARNVGENLQQDRR